VTRNCKNIVTSIAKMTKQLAFFPQAKANGFKRRQTSVK